MPKKNDKLRVCINFRKLNEATITDPFPKPFLEVVLDQVARKEAYSMMDRFSGYSQVQLDVEAKTITTFITGWGAF